MDAFIAGKWVERLRNGGIEQHQGGLGTDDGARCCLGVLCDLAVEAGVIPPATGLDEGDYIVRAFRFDGEAATLPERVKWWAGMKSRKGGYDRKYNRFLSKDNDGCTSPGHDHPAHSFAQIADIIEANVENL